MSIRKTTLMVGAIVAMTGLAVVAYSSTCLKLSNRCSSNNTLVVWTGVPTTVCQQGVNVIKITSSANCADGSNAGPVTVLRCADSKVPFTYDGGSWRHKLGAKRGWGAAQANCSNLFYSVSKI